MGRSSRPKKSPPIPTCPPLTLLSLHLPPLPPLPTSSSASLGTNGKPLTSVPPIVGSSLVKGSLKTISSVPKYVDPKEWIAVNLFDFFNNLNQFYGVLTEFCTPSNNLPCPLVQGWTIRGSTRIENSQAACSAVYRLCHDWW